MRTASWLLFFVALPCCATLGGAEPSDLDLPSSGVGPFRALTSAEVRGVAPYVLDAPAAAYREPAVLAADPSDASSSDVLLYAVAAQGSGSTAQDVIVRTQAQDARSFYGTGLDLGATPAVVLSPSAAWEGTSLSGPSAVRIGGQILLYYAAAGGIGVATSQDGLTFQKPPAPVLTADPSVTWETTAPSAPSVAVYPDGQVRMLYAAGVSIGEASSSDGGMTWQRLDSDPTTPAIDPVLSPSTATATDAAADASLPFDSGQVADPCLAPRMTAAGRIQVRVLYTGLQGPPGAASRPSAIGFAARYGDSGPLVRQASPVLSLSLHEAAPALFEWSDLSMVYVQMDETSLMPSYPAIGAAVAPATVTLPAPLPYAASP